MKVDPSQIIVGTGTEFMLGMLMELLDELSFDFENPCYPKIPRLMQSRGTRVCQVPVDSHGMSMDGLEQTKANVAFVTPSHHFPLGMVVSIGRRLQLLKWTHAKDNRYIIEDDYNSDFRLNLKPIPATHSLGKDGKNNIF